MELQRRRSSGTAKGGLATGIVGSSLGVLNSLALMGAGVNAAARNNENNGCSNGCNSGWNGCNGWNGYNGWGPGFGFGSYGIGFGPYGFGSIPQMVVVNTNEEGNRGYGRDGRYYDNEGGCSDDHFVNRYELGLQQKLAEKDSQIALRDANTYNDQKMLEMYKYIDGQLKDVRSELSRQAVINQKTEDSFALVAKDVQCCCDKLEVQIARERDERKCADNSIITYTNATFYPKMVADVTTGTTTTAQSTYNPLPCNGGCSCNNNNR